MSAIVKENYGPYFDMLSAPEQRAVEKYVRRMAKYYPDLAQEATAGPGNEGAVYVYISRPSNEDEYIKIVQKTSRISLDILIDTGVYVLLMLTKRITALKAENGASGYGPCFDWLSAPEQRAVEKYLRRVAKDYPSLAEKATAGPGNEGAVYVYFPRRPDDDESLKIQRKLSKIGLDILIETGVHVIRMSTRRKRRNRLLVGQ